MDTPYFAPNGELIVPTSGCDDCDSARLASFNKRGYVARKESAEEEFLRTERDALSLKRLVPAYSTSGINKVDGLLGFMSTARLHEEDAP